MNPRDLINRIDNARELNKDAQNQLASTQSGLDKWRMPVRDFGWKLKPGDSRPYAFLETHPGPLGGPGGIEYGLGLFGHRSEDGQDKIDLIYYSNKSGFFQENGNTRLGFKQEGGVFNADVGGIFQGGFLTGNLELSAGNDGLTVAGGLNLINGTFTFGGNDPNNDQDMTTRVGVGIGVGAGLRFHWDDTDNDGEREFGVGVDQSFLSLDVKREG